MAEDWEFGGGVFALDGGKGDSAGGVLPLSFDRDPLPTDEAEDASLLFPFASKVTVSGCFPSVGSSSSVVLAVKELRRVGGLLEIHRGWRAGTDPENPLSGAFCNVVLNR